MKIRPLAKKALHFTVKGNPGNRLIPTFQGLNAHNCN